MELGFYLLIFFIALALCSSKYPVHSEYLFRGLYLAAFAALSLIVRLKYDWDIENYARSMSHTSLSIYYIKEPFVWLGQRNLFSLFGSTYAVFFFFDMLVGTVLYIALRKLNAPQYIYFSILLFFPFILGMQNVYRQWVSEIIFIYTFSIVVVDKAKVRSLTGFVFAVLSHNVAAVFLPLLFVFQRKIFGRIAFVGAVVIAVFGLFLGSGTKSDEATGLTLDLAYLTLIIMMLVLFVVLDKGRPNRSDVVYWVQIVVAGLILASYFALSSAGTERIAMYGLILLYPYLALKLEGFFKEKISIRVIYLCFGFLPIFFFETSEVLVG